MIRKILALLILAALCNGAPQYFRFTTTLECRFKDRSSFAFNIRFKERDHLSWWNDNITKQYKSVAKVGRTKFIEFGTIDGDEIFSNRMEPYAEIWHDCTQDREEVQLIVGFLPKCDFGMGKPCHYNVIIDLTEEWGIFTREMEMKYDLLPFDRK